MPKTLRQEILEVRAQASPRGQLGPVDCDRIRLSQLVSNLVANVLTHGAADCPVLVRTAADHATLEICVSNAGEQIPPATLDRLFEPFERGVGKPGQQGLGLGLYIATQIAPAHGGTLTATSSPEETRFIFRIPYTFKIKKMLIE